MPRPERMRFGTFTLRGDADGVVHLQGPLPEVVAIGTDAWLEFQRGVPQLGGPHAQVTTYPTAPADLRVTTPEAEFVYTVMEPRQDSAGWYLLCRLTFTSVSYHEFLAGH